MKVVFTGDVFLGGDLAYIDGSGAKVINSRAFSEADKIIVNLESPLSDNGLFANKGVLYAQPKSAKLLSNWGVSAANLANNHIQDKGNSGIKETIEILEKNEVNVFGAGNTLGEAERPFFITKRLCVLGYCQFNSPTLNFIQVADEKNPGVNPLTYEKIFNDLSKIPDDSKAVLYFHWGHEHLWFTQSDVLSLAKKLLEHSKVAFIVGMHPHRIQGSIKHAGKYAFFSLGNFLFPNFYIVPPARLFYPQELPKKIDITYQYHKVSKLTYKKWRIVNRLSYLVCYDTESEKLTISPVIQDLNYPNVRDLTSAEKYLFDIWYWFLSIMLKCPDIIYSTLHLSNKFVFKIKWRLKCRIFHLKQNGFL